MKVINSNHTLVSKLLLTVFCIFAVTAIAAAQSTVSINGTVKDQSGAAVPATTITATNVQTNIASSAQTDDAGRYTILSIPPGMYDVQAAQKGFSTVVRRNQELLVGTVVTLDFTLQVSAVAQTVQVTGQTPVVDTTQSTVATVLQTNQLDDLPLLDRNFYEMASLSPGVQTTQTATTNFSVGGAAAGLTLGNSTQYGTGYVVDDVPITKPADGGYYAAVAQDWVQEFSVVTNQSPAEIGGAVSGVINAVTRSGTNTIHGRAYGFIQNNDLNAAPFSFTAKTPKPPSSLYRIGGMIGGPILKDKLFYFAGYEYFRNVLGISFPGLPSYFAGTRAVVARDLTPAALSNLNRQDLAELKITYQINPSNLIDLISNIQEIGLPTAYAGTSTSLYNGNSTRNGDYMESAIWKHTFSPTALNDLRVDTARDWDDEQCLLANAGVLPPFPTNTPPLTQYGVTPYGNPTGYYAALSYPSMPITKAPGSPTENVTVGCGGRWGGSHFIGLYAGIYDTFTKSKGKHVVKFGGSADDPYYGFVHNRTSSDGTYTFLSGVGPFNPANPATYPIGYSVAWGPDSISYANAYGWAIGVFIQDTWKVSDKLTLNPGIRYDMDFSYNNFNKQDVVPGGNTVNNDYDTAAPRLGVAWMPFANQNTVIRGGFGVYYGLADLSERSVYLGHRTTATVIDSFTANSAQANPYCVAPGVTCTSGSSGTLATKYQPALQELMAWALVNNTLPNQNLTTITVGGNTFTLPGTAGTPVQSGIINIAQNRKVPGTVQVTGGGAHSFNNGFSFTADFVWMYGYNQTNSTNTNVNPVQPITPTGGVNFLNPSYTTYWTYGNSGIYETAQLLTKVNYRNNRGDFAQVAYTLSHADNNAAPGAGVDFSVHTPSSSSVSTDPLAPGLDWGPTATEQRHVVSINGTAILPLKIALSPIIVFGTGMPFTPTTTQTASAPNPTMVRGVLVQPAPNCQVYFNICYPEIGGVVYTKGSMRGYDQLNVSARLQRSFKIGETRSITGLFEAYNIPNRVNIQNSNINTNALSTSFLGLTGTAGAMRQLQFGARFDF